jgi:hypothetical protein
MPANRGEHSVCEFFCDESYAYVDPRFVDAKTAMDMARKSITSLRARTGLIKKVIVTDGGDCINFEWRHGIGVTFPPLPRE